MKRISFFLALTLLLLSFGLVNAQETHHTSLDMVVGEWDDGGTRMLTMDADNKFHIRFTNNGTPDCKFAPAFSFVFLSTDGAEWGGITSSFPMIDYIEIVPGVGYDIAIQGLFSEFFEEQFTTDGGGPGVGSDTIGFAGVVFAANIAFKEGMDTVAIILSIHPTLASEGKTICFDYGMARTDGYNWGWNGVGVDCEVVSAVTTTDGQQCFGIGKPPDLPPVFVGSTPTTIEGSHCEVLSYPFLAEDPDPGEGPGPDDVTYTCDIGAIDLNTGAWTYTGDLAGVGTAITLNVTAHEADNTEVSVATVNIVLTNEAPEFTDGCGATFLAKVGQITEHTMAGADNCTGDPMTMLVVDAAGLSNIYFVGNVLTVEAAEGEETGSPYTVEVGITDGVDDGATCTVTINVTATATYVIRLEKTHGTIQGGFEHVSIMQESSGMAMGGFNFLVAYDASALTFQGAEPGTLLKDVDCRWEYFTYRFGPDGNCGIGCPSGLVRVVGIKETNNGVNHPGLCDGPGEIADLSFLVSNDRTLECQYIPIRFFWIECGDNTISDDASQLYIANTVREYPWNTDNLFPETEEFPEEHPYFGMTLPTFVGPMGCMALAIADEAKFLPLYDIDFENGGIDIVCADSIDARGDLNLDGLAYTIADAVMYSNYFVYGLTALVDITTPNMYGYIPHYAGSIAASDVNADGLSLTVADLVYLIRVVVGDAVAYDKVSPITANLTVGSSLSVDGVMGAAYVVLAGDQSPVLTADNMEIKSVFDGENTRVLVWSQTGESFSGEFLSNVGDVISTELASAAGATVMTKTIPANFALGQNYPNPFNPTTSIALALPVASDYTLTIYNVTGQVVTTIAGAGDAGFQTVEWDASNNASGVYFYKLTAGNFTDTKKMVLLK